MIDNVLKIKQKIIYVGTIPKSNIKITERGKINTPSTQIYDPSISWLGTSIKSDCMGANCPLLVTWWGNICLKTTIQHCKMYVSGNDHVQCVIENAELDCCQINKT